MLLIKRYKKWLIKWWIQTYKKGLWQMKENFMANGCNSLPWTFFLFLLTCLDRYKFFFYMGHTSPRWNYTKHVITHLLAYFAIMTTPNSIKTDNGPAYISKQFKQFLHSFFIKHFTDIPYNPQTQDIIKHINTL